MAYSKPFDIKEIRDQAALISMVWKEAAKQCAAKSKQLETLTIEFTHNNIIMHAIQPNFIMVMVGGIPPNKEKVFKATPEAKGDPRYPPTDLPESDAGLSQTEKDIKLGLLHVQRRKMDKLCETIRKEFERTGFQMPDEGFP